MSISDPTLGSSIMLHTTPDVLKMALATGCNFWFGALEVTPDDPAVGGSVTIQGLDYWSEVSWEKVVPVAKTGPTLVDMSFDFKESVFSITVKVEVGEVGGTRRLLGFAIDSLVLAADVGEA